MPDRRLFFGSAAVAVVACGFAAWRFLAAPPAPMANAPSPALAYCPTALPVRPSAAVVPSETGPGLAERSLGRADAPVTVIEYFSLTCSHCGAFHRDTWPRVRRELVETGRVRMVFRDFPLDEISLRAHAVARSFPPDRYEPFISALFATQDRWAFARGVDHKAEIGKIAAMAGMSTDTFNAAWADDALARAILEARQRGEAEHQVSATPTFIIGTQKLPGAISSQCFESAVREATPQ
jgi:protein-disulfide isomerase